MLINLKLSLQKNLKNSRESLIYSNINQTDHIILDTIERQNITNNQFNLINSRLSNIEANILNINETIKCLNSKIDKTAQDLNSKIDSVEKTLNKRMDNMDFKIDDLTKGVNNIAEILNSIKSSLD